MKEPESNPNRDWDNPGKFWVYKRIKNRKDNGIAIAIAIERPKLIVITTMVNWSPV